MDLCVACYNLVFCEKDHVRTMTEVQVAGQICPFCASFYQSMLEQNGEHSFDLICRFEGRTFKDGFVQVEMIVLTEEHHRRLVRVSNIVPSPEMLFHWRIAYLDSALIS